MRAYFTIFSKNHLAHARVLAKRLRALDPAAEFYGFLADRPDGCFKPAEETFQIVPLEAYASGQAARSMSFYYDAAEFCFALRGHAHAHINALNRHDEWMYLDCDIYPVAAPEPLFAQKAPLVLTPHRITPTAPSEIIPGETSMLQCGIYNGGCLAARRSPVASAFIQWFISRLEVGAFRFYHHCYGDQLWLNFIPLWFPECAICRHPGANVAYWNFFERPLSRSAGGVCLAGERPLLFLHFSAWDPMKPEEVSIHYRGPTPDLWFEFAKEFAAALTAAGHQEIRTWPYSFDRYENQKRITLEARRGYFERLRAGTWTGDNPFSHPELEPKKPSGARRMWKRLKG